MKIILRILVTPFVFCIILITHIVHVFHRTYLFIRYGGELIGYEENDTKTIKDLYKGLQIKKIKQELIDAGVIDL